MSEEKGIKLIIDFIKDKYIAIDNKYFKLFWKTISFKNKWFYLYDKNNSTSNNK